MRALAVLVLAVSYAFAGPQEVEPSIAEEVAALIEKTSALHAFHLVLANSDEATLELAYREPWDARLTLKSSLRSDDICLDERRYHRTEPEGDSWRYFDLPHTSFREALDQLFPLGKRLGGGGVFELHGELHDEDGFGCDISFDLSGRDSPFGWFARMQEDLAHVTRDGNELLWTDGALELHLSRATGLPQEIVVAQEGLELDLRLQTCRTDEEAADLDELLAAPEEGELDELFTEYLALMSGPQALRQDGFERVEAQLRAGKRAWDTDTRDDWDSFLTVLHGAAIEQRWHEWTEQLRADIDEGAEWAHQELEKQDTSERRARLAKFRDGLEQVLDDGFDSARETYLSELLELSSEPAEQREELLDLERQVIERMHEERIADPVRAYLTKQFDAALGGK